MRRLTAEEYITGVRAGDRVVLSQAITLIESRLAQDQAVANVVLDALYPDTGQSVRIGITGVPGVGKSTFIEAFGQFVVGGNYVVGFVLFLVLVAIQFLVVAHEADEVQK